jgi:hypothetical protein
MANDSFACNSAQNRRQLSDPCRGGGAVTQAAAVKAATARLPTHQVTPLLRVNSTIYLPKSD